MNKQIDSFKNPGDIYDQPTWEDLAEEVLFEEVDSCISNNVEGERKEFADRVVAKFAEALVDWRKEFEALLQERPLSTNMMDFLKDRKIDLPRVEILGGESVKDFLIETETPLDVSKNNLLVVFNLPKPLSQFWWKGGSDTWGNASVEVRRTVIEWGYFYRKLIPIIWNTVDEASKNNIFLRRLNPINLHDPKKYYYMWEVSDQAFNDDY